MAVQRARRAQASLGDQDFDRFLSSSSATVQYLTGFRSMASRLYEDTEVFVVVSPNRTVLVVPFGQAAAALDAGVDPSALIAFGEFSYFGDPDHAVHTITHVDSLSDALRVAESWLGRGSRYGVERTRLSVSGAEAVAEVVQSPSRVDATAWIAGLRSVKTPEEIDLLRRAAQLSEQAISAAFAMAKAGTTEREIAEAIAATMVAGGGEPAFLSVQTGSRAALGDAYPSSRAWSAGEFLRIDTGCIIDGYWSDIARTAFLGTPTPDQERTFEALRVGQQHELDTIRPGLVACDLFAATTNIIRAEGLRDFKRHHCGHGIGLSIYDAPRVNAVDSTEFEAGMVLCLETPYYAMNEGGILTEDTVVLTESGCQSFTSLPRGLHIVN